MPRAIRCTGSRWSKLFPAGDGHGRPTKGCQQGGARAPPQARHPRASRGVAPSLQSRCFPSSQPRAVDPSGRIPDAGSCSGRSPPEPQRQLRQIATELKQTGGAAKRFRPQLKPGTRLMREWQGRTYEVVVLDDGFSWQGTRYNSLSAIARKITGTAWSGPLFFGLKQNRSAGRRPSQAPLPILGMMEGNDVAG
jgi:Protein of unknown function (DUF2924)